MKFYTIFSIIINILLISFIVRNHTIYDNTYQIDWDLIPNIYLYIMLIIKLVFDLGYFLFKKNIIKKLSYFYVIFIIILFFIFSPKSDKAFMSLETSLKQTIKINKKFYSKYKRISKIPDKLNFLKKQLDYSPYLKNGKKIKYKLDISYGKDPVTNPKGIPGVIFLVIDKENNDYIFTTSIIDPKTNNVGMLHLNNDLFFIDKKLNDILVMDYAELLKAAKNYKP